jgi:pimeloyl-ACP methyl ester carboxylesterase
VSTPSALPLVAIPALLCDEALYRDVLTALHDGRDTRVMVASHPEMRDSVAAILDAAPERFVLAGSSYGGTVAIEVALAAPERVAALWLNGCDPGATNRDGNLGLASLLETATEAAVGYLASVVVRPQASAAADAFRDMAHRTGGTVGGAQARALAARTDAWDRLAALTMPTLLIWGEQDAAIPVAVGQRLAAALPNARLHVLPECGHLPTLERPHEVAGLVREWMRGVAPTGSVAPRRPDGDAGGTLT